MKRSDKLITEILNDLSELSSKSIELQQRAPLNNSDYGIDKKAWIEEAISWLESIKIDYYIID